MYMTYDAYYFIHEEYKCVRICLKLLRHDKVIVVKAQSTSVSKC